MQLLYKFFFHTERISTVASPKLKVQENLKTSQCSTVVRNTVVRAVMKVIGWEIPDFGPPSSLTPGAIDLKFGTVVYIRGTTPHAKNGKNWPSRVALAQGWNIMFKGFLKKFWDKNRKSATIMTARVWSFCFVTVAYRVQYTVHNWQAVLTVKSKPTTTIRYVIRYKRVHLSVEIIFWAVLHEVGYMFLEIVGKQD